MWTRRQHPRKPVTCLHFVEDETTLSQQAYRSFIPCCGRDDSVKASKSLIYTLLWTRGQCQTRRIAHLHFVVVETTSSNQANHSFTLSCGRDDTVKVRESSNYTFQRKRRQCQSKQLVYTLLRTRRTNQRIIYILFWMRRSTLPKQGTHCTCCGGNIGIITGNIFTSLYRSPDIILCG